MSERTRLPARRLQITEAIEWEGQSWLASIGFDAEGVVREIFLKDGRGNRWGSALARLADDVCILASRLLQHGARVGELVASLEPPHHDTGAAPPTLLLLALQKAAIVEAEAGEGIRQAMLFAARDRVVMPEGEHA